MWTYGQRNINTYWDWVGKTKRRRPLEDLGIDRRIILKCVFKGIGWDFIDWMNLT
jgi:hypothetical protein